MKKKILLAGYYGFGNLGDDLLLHSYISQLKEHFDLSILVSTKYEIIENQINRWSPSEVLRALRQCDVLLFGGGGILQDQTGFLSLWYYLGLIFIARLLGKSVYLLAQGVGPLSSFNLWLTRRILKNIQKITVRDKKSSQILNGSASQITADSTLTIPLPAPERARRENRNEKIVLIPRGMPHASGVSVQKIYESLIRFTIKNNMKLLILPFQPSEDHKITAELRARFGEQALVVTWETPLEALKIMNEASLVISGRLHGLILASILSKPWISLLSEPKIVSWLDELELRQDLKDLLVPFSNSNQNFNERIENVWSRKEEAVSAVQKRIPDLKSRALADFEWLRAL